MEWRINIRIPMKVGRVIEQLLAEREDAPDKAVIIRQLLVEALVARGKL